MLLKALFLRLFSGIAAGLLGMIFSLIVLFLVSFARPEATQIIASYSMMAILAMVFVGTMSSNLFAVFFLSLLNPEKYSRRRKMLKEVFIFTMALFVFTVPFYLVSGQSVVTTAGIHFLFAALITALLAEIISNWEYALTGLMGVVFSGCFVAGIFAIFLKVLEYDSILLIFALPLAWTFIPLSIFLVEAVQNGLRKPNSSGLFSLKE